MSAKIPHAQLSYSQFLIPAVSRVECWRHPVPRPHQPRLPGGSAVRGVPRQQGLHHRQQPVQLGLRQRQGNDKLLQGGKSVWNYQKIFQERRHEFGSVRERRSGRSGGSREGGHGEGHGRSGYGRSRHAATTGSLKLKKDLLSKSVDYSDMDTVREGEKGVTRKQRSKSSDHLHQSQVT